MLDTLAPHLSALQPQQRRLRIIQCSALLILSAALLNAELRLNHSFFISTGLTLLGLTLGQFNTYHFGSIYADSESIRQAVPADPACYQTTADLLEREIQEKRVTGHLTGLYVAVNILFALGPMSTMTLPAGYALLTGLWLLGTYGLTRQLHDLYGMCVLSALGHGHETET